MQEIVSNIKKLLSNFTNTFHDFHNFRYLYLKCFHKKETLFKFLLTFLKPGDQQNYKINILNVYLSEHINERLIIMNIFVLKLLFSRIF